MPEPMPGIPLLVNHSANRPHINPNPVLLPTASPASPIFTEERAEENSQPCAILLPSCHNAAHLDVDQDVPAQESRHLPPNKERDRFRLICRLRRPLQAGSWPPRSPLQGVRNPIAYQTKEFVTADTRHTACFGPQSILLHGFGNSLTGQKKRCVTRGTRSTFWFGRDETEGGTRLAHAPARGSELQWVRTSYQATSYRCPKFEEIPEPEVPPSDQPANRFNHQAIEANREEIPDGCPHMEECHGPKVADGSYQQSNHADPRLHAMSDASAKNPRGEGPLPRPSRALQRELEETSRGANHVDVESHHHYNDGGSDMVDINDSGFNGVINRSDGQVDD
ncbi:MAG: hypothetical protein Q9210_007369 [Variospora velana]